jgi:hypothetical protein
MLEQNHKAAFEASNNKVLLKKVQRLFASLCRIEYANLNEAHFLIKTVKAN